MIKQSDPLRRSLTRPLCLLSALLFGLPALSPAEELSPAVITAAVETWVRHVTADARPAAVVEDLRPCWPDGQTTVYVAHLQGGGFCLCGADDLVLPVYFYSPRGRFDPTHPALRYILREISARTVLLRNATSRRQSLPSSTAVALDQRALTWQDLADGYAPSPLPMSDTRAAPSMMALPLTCTWSQHGPYNAYCPSPDGTQHVVVGCVATAMSQVMYYWRWPPYGTGSASVSYTYRWRTNWDTEPLIHDPGIPLTPPWPNRLTWSSFNGGELLMTGFWDDSVYDAAVELNSSSDYRDALAALWGRMTVTTNNHNANPGTYDWSQIRDSHSSPYDPSDHDVAQLCYDAAVCVEMEFGLVGSSAFTQDVLSAMNTHFYYDSDADYGLLNTGTMTADIQWYRPVIMRGNDDTNGGHAWVVYGYNTATDPDRQFLMNFGWGGSGNGWYSCDAIDAVSAAGIAGVPDGIIDFNLDQHCVTRLAPLNVGFAGDGNSGDGSPGSPWGDLDEALAEAADDAIIILPAGSIQDVGSLLISQPLTLRGHNVLIR